jgi:PIN domain nuclease of toxin-antitoxin system
LNLLLDTHILLWWLADSRRLKAKVRRAIENANAVWVSSVSGWEIEAKRLRGLVEAPNDLEATLRTLDIRILPLSMSHAVESARLPLLHRDPFDRMLVAQASLESLTLCTHDSELAKYRVPLFLA